MKKKVFIVILTWNKKDLVLECLKSVLKCRSKHEVHYVVVDNHSTDGTVKEIEQKYPQIVILKNKSNLGWTGGNNTGILYSLKEETDFIIILSNDLVVEKNFIDTLIQPFEDMRVGIVGPTILTSPEKKIIKSAGYKFNKKLVAKPFGSGKKNEHLHAKNRMVEMVQGAAMGIRSEVFRKVGLLDDKFFIYFEESDFCMRTRKAGYSIVAVANSIIYHIEAATTVFNSPFHTYYNTRNHLLFIEKYGRKKILINVMYDSLQLAARKLKHGDSGWKYVLLGVFDYLFRRFGKRVYW